MNENKEFDFRCSTCERAEIIVDKDYVLCDKKGIVSAGGYCRKFVYDPLKREPPKRVSAPKLDYVDIDTPDAPAIPGETVEQK